MVGPFPIRALPAHRPHIAVGSLHERKWITASVGAGRAHALRNTEPAGLPMVVPNPG